jgi:hypothetical protein
LADRGARSGRRFTDEVYDDADRISGSRGARDHSVVEQGLAVA